MNEPTGAEVKAQVMEALSEFPTYEDGPQMDDLARSERDGC